MRRKITFMQYGCGKMAKYLMRYAMEKGAKLLAAFDVNPVLIGKDVSEIIGDGYPNVGITVSPAERAQELMEKHHPDVCIIATRSTVAELEDIFTLCAKCGVNAITTCEEALYPWNSSPRLTRKLDRLAKEGGCTLTGVGYCDLYWGTMVTNFTAAQASISKIRGASQYNVRDYGIALAQGHGVGLKAEQFADTIGVYNDVGGEEQKKLITSGKFTPCYMWNQNGWLCSQMGLHVLNQTQKCYPIFCETDLFCDTLDLTVPAGNATGMRAVVTTETREGITLETECIGKVYTPQDYDFNTWTLEGEPNSTLICREPATAPLTCGAIVNRIPQLLNAAPGYVTTDRFPYPIYCIKNLSDYVKAADTTEY